MKAGDMGESTQFDKQSRQRQMDRAFFEWQCKATSEKFAYTFEHFRAGWEAAEAALLSATRQRDDACHLGCLQRYAIIEECAKVCDEYTVPGLLPGTRGPCNHCATAIRALKNAAPQGSGGVSPRE